MKILINTATVHVGGAVQVARSLLEELKVHRAHQFAVVLGLPLQKELDVESFPDNFRFYPISYRPATRFFDFRSASAFHRKVELVESPDVVFTTTGPAYWRPKCPHLVGYNLPHYIYPDSPFFTRLSWIRRLKFKLKGLIIRNQFRKESDAIVGQTEDVAQRGSEWLGIKRHFTVGNTCNAHYFRSVPSSVRVPHIKDNDVFKWLTISGYHTHKNLESISKVAAELHRAAPGKHHFYVTLKSADYEKLYSEVEREWITNIGPVPSSEGPALYHFCDGMFLPTLLECFSASYVEAMAMGRPIVTTNLSFAKIICDSAAAYYSAESVQQAAKQLERIRTDHSFREGLIQNGKERMLEFPSATKRADMYLEACQALLREQQNELKNGRSRQ